MTARRPWRQCPDCVGRCHWVEPAWVCVRNSRHEFTQADADRFAPPGGKVVDLATCSYSEFRDDMGVGVRISIGTPRWIKREEPWPYVPELAPRRNYLNAPEAEFIDTYLTQLRSVGASRIRAALHEVVAQTGGSRLVLLCFERLTTDWCHRRLFASYWYTTTGQEVPELGEVPTHEQLDLFDGAGS